MDTAPTNSSAATLPQSVVPVIPVVSIKPLMPPVTPVGTSSVPPVARKTSWIIRFIRMVFGGLVFGCVAAGLSLWLPNNRVVIFNQLFSTFVTVTSVRIAKPGFVVILADMPGGSLIEASYYLTPGYYRNLVVPINPDDVVNTAPVPLPLVVRLYTDDGDGVFDEAKDIPVKDIFGRLINEHIWLGYSIIPTKKYTLLFSQHPIEYITKLLFP